MRKSLIGLSVYVLNVVIFLQSSAFAAKPPITAVAISPDGKTVVSGSQSGIEIRDWSSLKVKRKLKTGLDQVHDFAFAPNGKFLLAAGGTPGEEGVVELFDWPSGKRILTAKHHTDVVYAVGWRPDSSGWASAGLDRIVQISTIRGTRALPPITGHSRGVKSVRFLSNGKLLVTSGIDQSVRVWSVETGKSVQAFNHHTRPVHDLAVRPQKNQSGPQMVVTVSDDRTVRLWQPTIGRMVRFARLNRTIPLAVRWTPDGSRIITVGTDGHLRIIDPDTVTILHNVAAITGWAYCLEIHPTKNAAIVAGVNGQLVRVPLPKQKNE
jgi:WD40 repeat protein